MPNPDHIKYRDVPKDVSRVAANICWQFIEELDWLSTDLEEIGRLVANVRFTDDSAEWQRRLREGAERLESLPGALERLSTCIRLMREHPPLKNNPENDPSNWVGGREFDPEFDMGCDDLECNATGEIEEVGSWFMDPATQLIYCRPCALRRGLIKDND